MVTAGVSANRRRRQTVEEVEDDYDDDSDEEKDRRAVTTKAYRNSCSLGRFIMNPCYCMIHSIVMEYQRRDVIHSCKWRRILNLIVLLFLMYILVTSGYSVPSRFHPHPLRLRSDSQVNAVPIILHSLKSPQDDIGGWFSAIPFFPKPHIDSIPQRFIDFGPLHINILTVENFSRTISSQDFEVYEDERNRQSNRMDLFPTSPKYDIEEIMSNEKCRPPNWKFFYFPNCNAFHEIDLSRDYQEDITSNIDKNFRSYLFSQGYYRHAWIVENVDRKEAIVLKTLRQKHDVSPKTFINVQRDAIIMERLTMSPVVVNIYGHCATTLSVEPIALEFEQYVVPGDGYMKQKDLNDKDDVHPRNNFTPLEKLKFALEMAESLAILHGYEEGRIVHDDVQLCQWLRNREGKLVLGDFNRAQILDWNEQNQEYCRYNNGYAFGNYRSPEEFAGRDLDEKIDIFSFGNNVYSMLTGLWPFYENEDDGYIQSEIIAGKTAFIDPRYRTRSYAEGKMVNLIEQCWRFIPSDRPDIFEIVDFLKDAIEETEFRENPNPKHASNY